MSSSSVEIVLIFVLLDFVFDCFNFLTKTNFYKKFFVNRNGLSVDKA